MSTRSRRIQELPNHLSDDDWQHGISYFSSRCAYCGCRVDAHTVSRDHIIPVSSPACPGTVRWNIAPACHPCNAAKADYPARDFLIMRLGRRRGIQRWRELEEYTEWQKKQRWWTAQESFG